MAENYRETEKKVNMTVLKVLGTVVYKMRTFSLILSLGSKLMCLSLLYKGKKLIAIVVTERKTHKHLVLTWYCLLDHSVAVSWPGTHS